MAIQQSSEPRKHHFVPSCWLSGFTDTADKNGTLWVTDLKKKKQWGSSPAKTGYIRDFYRSPNMQPDPTIAEKHLSDNSERTNAKLFAPGNEIAGVDRRTGFQNSNEVPCLAVRARNWPGKCDQRRR